MMLAIKKGPSPKPLPKVENIYIMVHRHACSKAAYEKNKPTTKSGQKYVDACAPRHIRDARENRSHRWNIEFLLPYILTLLSHVTVAYSEQCVLIAWQFFFFFPQPISVVQADCSCQGKWLEACWEARVVKCGWDDKGAENNHVCLTVKPRYRAAAKRACTVKSCSFSNW